MLDAVLDVGVALDSPEAGPKPTTSLRRRRLPLAQPTRQLAILDALDLRDGDRPADFDASVLAGTGAPLQPAPLGIFQINLGRVCNMTCRHCHVDAGPDRSEAMDRATAEACLAAIDRSGVHTVDLTGGAPELNANFRFLVQACVDRGLHVIDRCNLTVLLLPRFEDLPAWLADRGVEVVASLPHHRARNTDAQRGDGTFERSMEALHRLNAVGYGQGDPKRILTLMMNPAGAFLAPEQCATERQWKASLERNHGLRFDRLIALNNMPIARYLEWLEDSGNLGSYTQGLVDGFNPGAVPGIMCRDTLSVSWDGRLYDCDFNQMLDLEAAVDRPHVADFDLASWQARRIVTARHCYGCTAGAGSSCGGATA